MTTRERIGMALLGSIGIFLLAAGAIFVPANCPLPQPAKTIIVTATPMPTRSVRDANKISQPVKVPQSYLDQPKVCLATVKTDHWHALLNERGETVWLVPPGTQVLVDLIGPLYQGGPLVIHMAVFEQYEGNNVVVYTGGWAFTDGLDLDPACKLAK